MKLTGTYNLTHALFFFGIFLSLFIFFKLQHNETRSLSVIAVPQPRKSLTIPNSPELLNGNTITGKFRANHNNLGIVAFRFSNGGRIHSDSVIFRIKETGQGRWHYEHTYKTEQFQNNRLFPFGFPVIGNSAGTTYQFEIQSIGGEANDAIRISSVNPPYVAEYKYSVQDLKSNVGDLMQFMSGKLKSIITPPDYFIILLLLFVSFQLSNTRTGNLLKPIMRATAKKPWVIPVISLFILIVTLLAVISINYTHAVLSVDINDDGVMYKPALDVTHGLMINRDTMNQYGMLSILLPASFMKLFGESFVIFRLFSVCSYAVIAACYWWIWKKIMSPAYLVIALSFWILLGPYLAGYSSWSSVTALMFQSLTIVCLVAFIESKRPTIAFIAGVFSALTMLSRLPVGLSLSAAAALWFIIVMFYGRISKSQKTSTNTRSLMPTGLFWFIAGGISVSFVFLSWLYMNHALYDWWLQSVVFVYQWAFNHSVYGGYKPDPILSVLLFPKGATGAIWTIIPITCALAAGATLVRLFTSPLARSKNLIIPTLLLLTGLASWLQYYPISDMRHLYWAASPMIGLFVFTMYSVVRGLTVRITGTGHSFIRDCTVLILTISLIWISSQDQINLRIQALRQIFANYSLWPSRTYPPLLTGMRLSTEQAEYFSTNYRVMQRYLSLRPGTPVITVATEPFLLTFSDSQTNYDPLYVIWPHMAAVYPDIYRKRSKFIKDNRPLIIAHDDQMIPGYCQLSKPMQSSATSLKAYYEGTSDFTIDSITHSVSENSGNAVFHTAINLIFAGRQGQVADITIQQPENNVNWYAKTKETAKKISVVQYGQLLDPTDLLPVNYSAPYLVTLHISGPQAQTDHLIVRVQFGDFTLEGLSCYLEKSMATPSIRHD